MTLSAIHNFVSGPCSNLLVVCDIGGYDFVSYSQHGPRPDGGERVVCDIGGYDFVSYSQHQGTPTRPSRRCL